MVQLNYLAVGDINMEVHAGSCTMGTTWGQGDRGQGSDRDLGALLLCNATSAASRNLVWQAGHSEVVLWQHGQSNGRPVDKHSSHKSEACLCIHTHTHTRMFLCSTSFADGGDGCPFSPRSGGGCRVMMSSSSGGFQMYCSPLPMNIASWWIKSVEGLSQAW